MSETEIHIGKLRKLKLEISNEEFFKQKCLETDIELDQPTWTEQFFWNHKDQNNYFIIDDVIYEAFEHKKYEDRDDISDFIQNEDGTISFVTSFYNGGTCLSEVIEEEIKKMKQNV